VVAERSDVRDVSVEEVLRLLSTGAPGEILLSLLRQGPSQTKVLTHAVKGYTARTTYRYLPRLAEIGALERDDDPEGAARVVHTLSEPAGEELAALLDRFAGSSMTRLPGGQVDSREWTALGLLADLWEAGVVEALSRGPTSPSQLTRRRCPLSYHQLNRRSSRFKAAGYFQEDARSRRQRRVYALTPKARRTMGLLVGIGRWRHHSLESDPEGLTMAEMATALRALLPLANGAEDGGRALRLCIERPGEAGELWIGDDTGGRPWARGTIGNWTDLLLDGEMELETGGDSALARERLTALYENLWAPA
jgi:DNA-binding HxlR family transcriptional regulator